MEIESPRNKAHFILDKLPDTKVTEALSYLEFLENLPEDKIDAIEEWMENLGWAILGSKVAKQDWE